MFGENIVVNDFMFCSDHGQEYCHRCCCDHRMCNNMSIEDEIAVLVAGRGLISFDADVSLSLKASSQIRRLNGFWPPGAPAHQRLPYRSG